MLVPEPTSGRPAGHKLRYLIVAGVNALVFLGLLAAGLAAGWPYMIAILVAQLITIGCAFWGYRSLVFGSRGSIGGDFVRFLSVCATGAIASLAGTPVLVEFFGIPPLPAQVIAIVVVAIGSYLGHRFFSFRHRGTPGPAPPESGAGRR